MTDTTSPLLVETSAARVTSGRASARLTLRARGDLTALEGALGQPLPRKIGEVSRGAAEILCHGPDEWLILASDAAPLVAACAGVYPTHPHSLVEITGREVTYTIEGARAADLMTLGLARDIDGIAVGSAWRTLFDGATVVLWRDGDTAFRMDVWNSFAPHVGHLLEVGARELAAEAA